MRKLKMKDAPLMLEWMHDPSTVRDLRGDFLSKTIKDCEDFIESAQDTKENLHLAIADNKDEYMGTVSLKHISDSDAEFAIVMRNYAMGKGFSQYGMQTIFEIGFHDYHLREIYWCVSPENQRALRFYDKQGFKRSSSPAAGKYYTENEIRDLIWYSVSADRE